MATERCTQCGRELEPRQEGNVQGLFCSNCGWSCVTSYIPAIMLDATEYELHAIGADFRNEAHVKAVAAVSGHNFLGARKLLQEREPLVYKGKASRVVRAEATLTAAGVGVQIVPPFPHSQRKGSRL